MAPTSSSPNQSLVVSKNHPPPVEAVVTTMENRSPFEYLTAGERPAHLYGLVFRVTLPVSLSVVAYTCIGASSGCMTISSCSCWKYCNSGSCSAVKLCSPKIPVYPLLNPAVFVPGGKYLIGETAADGDLNGRLDFSNSVQIESAVGASSPTDVINSLLTTALITPQVSVPLFKTSNTST